MFKRNLILAGVTVVSLLPGLSHAAELKCTNPTNPNVVYPIANYADLTSLPPINPNVEVGATLATAVVHPAGGSPSAGPTLNYQCNYYIIKSTFVGSYPYLGNKIYQTPVEGVGLRLRHGHGGDGWYEAWPMQFNFGPNQMTGFNMPHPTMVIKMEFVKTGPITGRGVLAGEYGSWTILGANGGSIKIARYLFSGDLQIKAPTCAAAAQTQNVDLGTIPAKKFTGIGTVSELKPFAINLICSGGDENVDAKLYVTLTDNTNQSNTSNTLSLTSDSQAKGVGIQVFKDSTQLGFGPDSAAVGNKNQWYAGTTGNGFFSIPLQARFVQTSQTVTPGPAKGRMTFTISYQ
ncbi:fimbrial protein [Burkholderia ambifaria]|uniref:fimbrial protein n=1 Tax=Burkholderia ambifaria TaxID=152480 RepID=UPI0011B212F3|nr:fimbrial protein [Burkholderia ambifaria]MBR8335377.1 fimbrial protein [Burkholderia ambifaria]